MKRVFVALLLALLVPSSAFGDYLEIRRAATVKAAPESQAAIIAHFTPGAVLPLASPEQTDGYYQVSIGAGSGWIYRTLVRRHAGEVPGSPDSGTGTEVTIPPASESGADASAFRVGDCGPVGDAKIERVKTLNQLKNRLRAPAPGAITSIGVDELLYPGDDTNRWSTSYAVQVVGYVADVKKGGVETCNCHATSEDGRDTHIELAADEQSTNERERVVVEITPAWRDYLASQGVVWAASTTSLRSHIKGHWIRVRGWMFFDSEHADEAENTTPGRAVNWRGTAWEVHPITNIELLPPPVQ